MLATLALVTSAALAGQTGLTVGGPGSGAPFQEIADAVAATAPGGSITVGAGNYAPFVVDKPLTIVGVSSAVVIVEQGPVEPAIRVTGIAAGEVVVLAGLAALDTNGDAPLDHPHLRLEASPGSIALVDVRAGTAFGVGYDAADPIAVGPLDEPSVEIAGCAAVHATDCVFQGATASAWFGGWWGASDALRVEFSRLWLTDSEIYGGDASPVLLGEFPVIGGRGIDAVDAQLVLARTVVRAGSNTGSPTFTHAAEPGMHLLGSTVDVFGGPGNLVRGGDQHVGAPGQVGDDWQGGPALRLTSGSVVTASPDAVLEQGASGPLASSWGTPPVSAADVSQFAWAAAQLPTVAPIPALAAVGGPLTVAVSTEPGAWLAVFVALAPTAPASLPPVLGDLLLPVGTAQLLATLVADGSGLGATTAAVPGDSALVGKSLWFQGVGPLGGQLQFTNVAAATLAP